MTQREALTVKLRAHAASSVHSWEDWAIKADGLMVDAANEITLLQTALELATRRGCNHCAEDVRKSRALISKDEAQP